MQLSGVFSLNRTKLTIVVLALFILPLLTLAFSPQVKAEQLPKPSDVQVDHVVEIRNGGLLIVNDTVTLLAKQGETIKLTNYTLGFPYGYQSNLDYAYAYTSTDPDVRLKLELDASMGQPGFYGTNIIFPQVTIDNATSFEFTVVFIFSNSITPIGNTYYNASFPAYPSLIQSASQVNLTVVFPTGLNYTASSYEDEDINFTKTTAGSTQYFNYVKSNLTEFSDQNGWFILAKAGTTLELLQVNELKRNIEFSGIETMTVTDSYRMVSKADNLATIELKLPKNASTVLAYDEFGQIPASNIKVKQGDTQTNVTVTFTSPYDTNREAPFSVNYQLPWKDYVKTEGWNDFRVTFPFSDNFDWTIRKLTITITLPEGAKLNSAPSAGLFSVQNTAFQNSLTLVFQNATPFQTLPTLNLTYSRAIFWESFRPALWMGAVVLVVGAVVAAWSVTRPTAVTVPSAITRIRAEDLRSFVDQYEDKRRLQRELETLEQQARKGKIPRRNYKVRKMTIESRMASLSRDLKTLEEKIRLAGPRFNDLMRQVEVAEHELQGVEADINRTEVRYRRGEITPAAYNKLLEDAYRRRDRSKTSIDGVLLRLREETI